MTTLLQLGVYIKIINKVQVQVQVKWLMNHVFSLCLSGSSWKPHYINSHNIIIILITTFQSTVETLLPSSKEF